MRNTLALILIALTATIAYGQKDVTNAYAFNDKGKYEEAAQAIERAITNEKAMVKEKTWRYRGNIYMNISQDSLLFIKYPNALNTAIESYAKAMELDPKGSYKTEQIQGIDRAQVIANNKAGTYYSTGNYKRSAELFQSSIKAAGAFGIVDTLGIYNTALCHEKAGMIPEAIDGYKKTGELGYQVPNVFLFVANLQKQQGDEEAALQTLADARKVYPREQSLIIEELNIYINRGDFELAKTNLELAAEQDPTNELLWFSLGTISDNLGKADEAQSAYLKALEVNADYFDANYNLGAMYFNKGVEKVKVANDVPPRETKKYDAIMTEANAAFQEAMPYLEKAFEVNSTDVQTIRSLRDIYARTGNDDKMLEMKKILDGMEK